MDQIKNRVGEEQSAPHQATSKHPAVVRLVTSVVPWLIIGSLLWAGLFIKPQPVGSTVQPPTVERRDHYYGMAMPEPGRILLAGSNGKIVALDQAGRAERIKTPTERSLQDIAAWDAKHAVAVGNDGVILHSADGGTSWAPAADVPRSQVANKLNRVRLGDNGIAVAAGEMGALLMSRDWGKTWSRLRPEEDIAWNDAAILPNGAIVAVGEFGHIALSGDGGKSWKDIKGPVQVSLMAVSFRDKNVGVAVGLEGVALITRDAGNTWLPLDIKAHDHLFDIAWDSATRRWIGAGSLARWISIDADGSDAKTGRLDERDLSWHTRVVPDGSTTWFTGANVGSWDGKTWKALGDSWQPTTLMNLPLPAKETP